MGEKPVSLATLRVVGPMRRKADGRHAVLVMGAQAETPAGKRP